MYTFDSRVRYSEIDQEGMLKPASLIQYMQDCSCFQSEELGIGWRNLGQEGVAWVITFWQILIEDYPKFYEWIRIGTKPWGFTPLFGMRNFLIEDEQGKALVKANSLWVLMDLKKGRPVRLNDAIRGSYPVEEKLEMDYCKERKINLPESMQSENSVMILPHHIDTNCHVNNAAYMEIALEMVRKPIHPKEIRIEYKMQARLGDTIYPRVGFDGTFYVISLENEAQKPYAIVALRA